MSKLVVKTSFVLSETQLATLARVLPHVEIEFVGILQDHTHPLHALERRISETAAYEHITNLPLRRYAERIVDVGGNPLRYENAGRSDVHCCCPVLSAKDYFYYVKRLNCDNCCNETAQNCAHVVGAILLFIHSIYYFTPTELAECMIRSGLNYAISVHHPFDGPSGTYLGESRFERKGDEIVMEVGGGERYTHKNVDWLREGRVVKTSQGLKRITTSVVRDNGVSQMLEIALVDENVPCSTPPTMGSSALVDPAAYGQLNLSDSKTAKWVKWASTSGKILTASSVGPWVYVTTHTGQVSVPKSVVAKLRVEFSFAARNENNLKCMTARASRLCAEIQMPPELITPTAHACVGIAFHVDIPAEQALLRTIKTDHRAFYAALALVLLLALVRPRYSAALVDSTTTTEFASIFYENVKNWANSHVPYTEAAYAKDWFEQWWTGFRPPIDDAANALHHLGILLARDLSPYYPTTPVMSHYLEKARCVIYRTLGRKDHTECYTFAENVRSAIYGAAAQPSPTSASFLGGAVGFYQAVGLAALVYNLSKRRYFFLYAWAFNVFAMIVFPFRLCVCLVIPIAEEISKSYDASATPYYSEHLIFGAFDLRPVIMHAYTEVLHKRIDGLYSAIGLHMAYNSVVNLMLEGISTDAVVFAALGLFLFFKHTRQVGDDLKDLYDSGVALWPGLATRILYPPRVCIPPIISDTPLGPLQEGASVEEKYQPEPFLSSFGTQLNGIAIGPLFPTAYAKHPDNDLRAVVNRQQLPTTADPTTTKQFLEFVEKLPEVLLPKKRLHVSRGHWLNRFPDLVREKYTNAMKTLLSHPPTTSTIGRLLFRPAFTKTEKANTSTIFGTKISDPRLVQSASPSLNAVWGPFFLALATFWKSVFGRFSPLVWAAGMTGDTLGHLMYVATMTRPDGVFIENDCSRFDASVQAALLTLRAVVYGYYMDINSISPLGVTYAKLLKWMVDKRGVTPFGVRYTTNATVASGDGDTSMWNFFLNAMTDLFAYVTNPVFEGRVTPLLICLMSSIVDEGYRLKPQLLKHRDDIDQFCEISGFPGDSTTHDLTAYILWSCAADQEQRQRDPMVTAWLAEHYFDEEAVCQDLSRLTVKQFFEWCYYKSFTNGDDFICYQTGPPALAHRHQVYKDLGFRPKLKSYVDIAQAEFCSAVYVPALQPHRFDHNYVNPFDEEATTITLPRNGIDVQYVPSYVLTVKPGRALAKAGFSCEEYSDEDSMSVQRGTAICLAHDGSHFPLIQAYARAVLRCTPGVSSIMPESPVIRNSGEARPYPEGYLCLHLWLTRRYGAYAAQQIQALIDVLNGVEKLPAVIDTSLFDHIAFIDNGWAAPACGFEYIETPDFRPLPASRPMRPESLIKAAVTETDEQYKKRLQDEIAAMDASEEFPTDYPLADSPADSKTPTAHTLAGSTAQAAIGKIQGLEAVVEGKRVKFVRDSSLVDMTPRKGRNINKTPRKEKPAKQAKKPQRAPTHSRFQAWDEDVWNMSWWLFTAAMAVLEEVAKRISWAFVPMIAIHETSNPVDAQIHFLYHCVFAVLPLPAAIVAHIAVNTVCTLLQRKLNTTQDRMNIIAVLAAALAWWPLGFAWVILAAVFGSRGAKCGGAAPPSHWLVYILVVAGSFHYRDTYEIGLTFTPVRYGALGLPALTPRQKTVTFESPHPICSPTTHLPYAMSTTRVQRSNSTATAAPRSLFSLRKNSSRRVSLPTSRTLTAWRSRPFSQAEAVKARGLLAIARRHRSNLPSGILDSFLGAASSLYTAVTGGNLTTDAIKVGKQLVGYAVDWLGNKLSSSEEKSVGPVEEELYTKRRKGKNGGSAAHVDKRHKKVPKSLALAPRPARGPAFSFRPSADQRKPPLIAHPHWTGRYKYKNPSCPTRFAAMQALLIQARSRALANASNGAPAPVQLDNQIPNMGFSMEMGTGVNSDDIILHGCEYVRAIPTNNPDTSAPWNEGDVIVNDNMAPADFPYLPRVDAISPLYTMYDADFEHIICPVADTSTSGGFAACYIPDPDEDITALSAGDRVRSAFMHPGSVSNNWWTPTAIKMPHQDGKFYLAPGSDARLVSQGKFVVVASTADASDSQALSVLLIRYSIRFKTARIGSGVDRAGSIAQYKGTAGMSVVQPLGYAPVADPSSTLDVAWDNAYSGGLKFTTNFGNSTHMFRILVTGAQTGSGTKTGSFLLDTTASSNVAIDTASVLSVTGGAPGSNDFDSYGSSVYSVLCPFSLYAIDPLIPSTVVLREHLDTAVGATSVTACYVEITTVQYDSASSSIDHFRDEIKTLSSKLALVADEVRRYEINHEAKVKHADSALESKYPSLGVNIEEDYGMVTPVQRAPALQTTQQQAPAPSAQSVRRSLKG